MEISFKNSTLVVYATLFVFWLFLVIYDDNPYVTAVLFFSTFIFGGYACAWTDEREWKNKWLNKRTTIVK